VIDFVEFHTHMWRGTYKETVTLPLMMFPNEYALSCFDYWIELPEHKKTADLITPAVNAYWYRMNDEVKRIETVHLLKYLGDAPSSLVTCDEVFCKALDRFLSELDIMNRVEIKAIVAHNCVITELDLYTSRAEIAMMIIGLKAVIKTALCGNIDTSKYESSDIEKRIVAFITSILLDNFRMERIVNRYCAVNFDLQEVYLRHFVPGVLYCCAMVYCEEQGSAVNLYGDKESIEYSDESDARWKEVGGELISIFGYQTVRKRMTITPRNPKGKPIVIEAKNEAVIVNTIFSYIQTFCRLY